MLQQKIEMSDVIYNAAEQVFEACVIIHSDPASVHYACSLPAPITTSFEEAARGLRRDALRQAKNGARNASYIRTIGAEVSPLRPLPRWSDRIMSPVDNHAA